jgi:hypothetical protein
MESILTAGIIPRPLSFEHPPSLTKAKSVNITAGSEGGGRAQGTIGDGRPHSIVDGSDECKEVLMCKALLEMGDYEKKP